MTSSHTPGPGGFGRSPAFPDIRHGITPVPAQFHPRPGIRSGPSALLTPVTHHVWLWAVLAVIVISVAAARLLRR